MQTRDWIEIIGTIIGGTSVLFLSFGYAYGQWRQGNNQSKLDNNSIYKERIEALELKVQTQNEEMKTQSEDIEKLTKEVHELHLAIDMRDKRFAEVILTLQGKDPVLQNFMNTVSQYITDNKPFIENIKMRVIPTIGKLDKFLDQQVIK